MDKKFSSDNFSSKLFWSDESGKEMDAQLCFKISGQEKDTHWDKRRLREPVSIGQEKTTQSYFNRSGYEKTTQISFNRSSKNKTTQIFF